MPRVIIEHLMDRLWTWLLLEYRNALRLCPGLVITNLPRKYHALFGEGQVSERSVLDIFDPERLVILDPQAEETLKPGSLAPDDVVVVGGILGSNPPLGRTRILLTRRARGARAYNIGPRQLTVDGAAYVACRVIRGARVEDIRYVDSLVIRTVYGSEVVLPYRYPLDERGRPVISEELLLLIRHFGVPLFADESDEEIWGDALSSMPTVARLLEELKRSPVM